MARLEVLTARCDRRECKTVVEIQRDTVAPEGWLQIAVELNGAWDSKSKLEFCSEKCVSLWAKQRGTSKAMVQDYERHEANGHTRNIKDEIFAAISILEEQGNSEFTIPDIARVAEIDKSVVRKNVYEIVNNDGEIESRGGSGKKTDPQRYAMSHRIRI